MLKTGLYVIKNVLQPIAEGVLIPSGRTASVLAADESVQKNINNLKK